MLRQLGARRSHRARVLVAEWAVHHRVCPCTPHANVTEPMWVRVCVVCCSIDCTVLLVAWDLDTEGCNYRISSIRCHLCLVASLNSLTSGIIGYLVSRAQRSMSTCTYTHILATQRETCQYAAKKHSLYKCHSSIQSYPEMFRCHLRC